MYDAYYKIFFYLHMEYSFGWNFYWSIMSAVLYLCVPVTFCELNVMIFITHVVINIFWFILLLFLSLFLPLSRNVPHSTPLLSSICIIISYPFCFSHDDIASRWDPWLWYIESFFFINLIQLESTMTMSMEKGSTVQLGNNEALLQKRK